ncbi:MAG: imidazole glycerol phosphate synthase subunit HisH [Candidatus Gracilibacteria bacterium]
MKIGIINYGGGNLKSVTNALVRLEQNFEVLDSPSRLEYVDKIIFPGVGSAKNAMNALKKKGFVEPIKALKKPFLGICLGMQLLSEFSEEGKVKCLDLIPGKVKKFQSRELKIPQIGWNKVNVVKKNALFDGIKNQDYFYFVNSYYFDAQAEYVIRTSDYSLKFPSVVLKNNFYAVQFHPEKSGKSGLKLLSNFCNKC